MSYDYNQLPQETTEKKFYIYIYNWERESKPHEAGKMHLVNMW